MEFHKSMDEITYVESEVISEMKEFPVSFNDNHNLMQSLVIDLKDKIVSLNNELMFLKNDISQKNQVIKLFMHREQETNRNNQILMDKVSNFEGQLTQVSNENKDLREMVVFLSNQVNDIQSCVSPTSSVCSDSSYEEQHDSSLFITNLVEERRNINRLEHHIDSKRVTTRKRPDPHDQLRQFVSDDFCQNTDNKADFLSTREFQRTLVLTKDKRLKEQETENSFLNIFCHAFLYYGIALYENNKSQKLQAQLNDVRISCHRKYSVSQDVRNVPPMYGNLSERRPEKPTPLMDIKIAYSTPLVNSGNRFDPVINPSAQCFQDRGNDMDIPEEPSSYRPTEKMPWPDGTCLVIGDSLLNGLEERKLGPKFKVRPNSGACVQDIYYHVTPLLEKKPTYVILMVGTDDTRQKTSREILEELILLKRYIIQRLPSCQVIFSCPTDRYDNAIGQLRVTNLRKRLALSTHSVILNDNINEDHLGVKGLHLNGRGSGKLAMNFLSYIRGLS